MVPRRHRRRGGVGADARAVLAQSDWTGAIRSAHARRESTAHTNTFHSLGGVGAAVG